MPLVKQHNTWAQAAGKGLPSAGNGPTDCSASTMENDQDSSSGSSAKVNRMEENVKESQIAAAFSEGWGQRGVNQDTAWEVPSSPHLSPKEGSTWNSSTSTGTDIWENNIRHHIKSSTDKPPPQMREPWGHTPSTHIGGTWGEEDNFDNNVIPDLYSNTSSNLLPHNNNTWQRNKGNNTVWGADPPENKSWGTQNHAMSTHIGEWGVIDDDKVEFDFGVPDIHELDYNAASTPKIDVSLESYNNYVKEFHAKLGTKIVDGKPWPNQNKSMLPPNRGGDSSVLQIGTHNFLISNENKSVDVGPHNNGPPWGDSSQDNRAFGNWPPATSDNKKMNPSGWEENAAAHQSGPNYDDGTAVWGNPVHQGKVSHWKEMPPNKQLPNCNMPPNNLCQNNNIPGPGMIRLPQVSMNKSDTSWMKNQNLNQNLNWPEGPTHRDPSGPRIWDEIQSPISHNSVSGTPNTPNSAFGNGGGGDSNHPMGGYWPPKSKSSSSSWADGQIDTSSWGGPLKQGGKPLTKDLIWASKQFRLLAELNFKKDDIENALRRHNMNLNDAFVELKEKSMLDVDSLSGLNLNQPPVHRIGGDELNLTEHSLGNSMPPGNLYGNNDFSGMGMFSSGLNVAQNVKNQNSVGNNIAPNLLGNAGANNQVPNFNQNNGINNLSPAMMRKILQQSQTFNPACLSQNPGRMAQQSFPPAAQLRLMVQQIQMAVQAGHLNPMILNQALAPATLQLLYELLQQIRFLHQLQQQQMFFSQHGSKPGSPPLQLSVQITQTKQHIVNLQNRIAAQQALFLKQQLQLPKQQQQPPSLQNPQPSTFDVKTNIDTMNGLHNEFRDLSIKDAGPQGHSRLNQWKLPSFDKDDNPAPAENNPGTNRENSSGEFSRAPGSVTKSSSANSLSSTTASHSSSSLTPLTENSWPEIPRSQSDSTSDSNEANASVQSTSDNLGSSNESSSDGSTKHNSASDNKDVPASSNPSTSSSSQSYNLNDLVPEFEPGKPWKGTSRIKNFEDDPHVTPGSIAKSPLSLTSIKDSDLFSWNAKPNCSNITTSPLTSSTWTYSPPPTSSSQNRQGIGRSWAGNTNRSSAEQDRMNWKGPPQAMPKAPHPPPGLGSQNKSDWIPGSESYPQGWSSNIGSEKQGGSNFLVLKNLTPQIDGSTLKTLCLQHGPLQLFHLLLNHGIALVRYSTREETEKARSALNNCVLSNTTILVDIPTELEVKQYLQLTSGQMNSGVSWPPGNGNTDSSYSSSSTFPVNAAATSPSSSSKMASANWNNTSLNLQGSSLWSYSGSGNGLWGMQTASSDHDQCIPSSLNSFLPNDLLGGGESI